ncbi:MAG: hypothetical protein FJZ59_02910 [Chlamydiae bacterium]|jgi:Ca2+/Na+ antiporter|nr:hypothetical protein [Chlamydiota bacterium]
MEDFGKNIANFIGVIGVILILLSYLLLQMHKISLKDFSYSFLNLIGSILILYSLLFHWNLPSVIIEVAWLAISIYGICKNKKAL